MPKKKFFDINSLPKDPLKINFNKPNLRQFVVVKYYYKDLHMTNEHVFTSDSFKEAIKIAYESLKDECYVQVEVYEADGKKSVCTWYPFHIRVLYKLRKYLK